MEEQFTQDWKLKVEAPCRKLPEFLFDTSMMHSMKSAESAKPGNVTKVNTVKHSISKVYDGSNNILHEMARLCGSRWKENQFPVMLKYSELSNASVAGSKP